ncbi:MAG: HAMP domain-containing protein [Granulosicoccus sp.]|nr:HAMP domain-containing protein [Granulosicoccus sp.]
MSLRIKTVLGVALIEAILLALLIYTAMKYMHENLEDALVKRANTTATLFASTAKDPVLSYDLASLDTFSEELAGNMDIVYVRTRGPDGLLLGSAGDSETADQPFIEDRTLDGITDGVFDVSATISESGVEFGRVEIGFNTNSIETSLVETRRLSTLIAIIEMVLVGIFSYILGIYLTKKLMVLRQAAKQVSQGNYSVQLDVDSADEVGDVSRAFVQMASVLKESQQSRDMYEKELEELNTTLEQRVIRRTAKIKTQFEELQATHQQLADTQSKLLQSEKLASIGQLSAGIAHEINNPISFVHSNANSLSEYIVIYQKLIDMYRTALNAAPEEIESSKKAITSYEAEEDIEFVKEDITTLIQDTVEGTVRVQEIVKGLRDFSHTDFDTKIACDVVACVESTLRIVNPELKSRCKVRSELNPIPEVLGNRGELNQVIMNLLMNAGQAMDEPGEVFVRTCVQGDTIELSVSDNGKGIEEQHIDKLFDPFFTTKAVGDGTGLGLSISYGIIKDHGGNIVVESEVGKGTTFTVYLPALDSDQLSEAA